MRAWLSLRGVWANADLVGYRAAPTSSPPALLHRDLNLSFNLNSVPRGKPLRLPCRCSFSSNGGNLRFRYVHSLLEVVKNKQADRRG